MSLGCDKRVHTEYTRSAISSKKALIKNYSKIENLFSYIIVIGTQRHTIQSNRHGFQNILQSI